VAYSVPVVQRAVTQSMPRAVTLSSCLLLSLRSISIHKQPAPTGSSYRWTGMWPWCRAYVIHVHILHKSPVDSKVLLYSIFNVAYDFTRKQ